MFHDFWEMRKYLYSVLCTGSHKAVSQKYFKKFLPEKMMPIRYFGGIRIYHHLDKGENKIHPSLTVFCKLRGF